MSLPSHINPCALLLCSFVAEPGSEFCRVHFDVHYDPIAGFVCPDSKLIHVTRDTSPKRKPKKRPAPTPAKKKKPSKPKAAKKPKKAPKPVKKPPLPQIPKRYAVLPPQKPKSAPAPKLTPEQIEQRNIYALKRTLGGFHREQKTGYIHGVKLHPWGDFRKAEQLAPVSKTE